MAVALKVPVRIRIDSKTAALVPEICDAFSAAFARAIETSLRSVVWPQSARPMVGALPTFEWNGESLASVDLALRRRLESALAEIVSTRVSAWQSAAPIADGEPAGSAPLGGEVTSALGAADAATWERFAAAPPATESWTRWLAITAQWDSLEAPAPGLPARARPAIRGELFDAQAAAFVAYFEHAIQFVPDVHRIVTTGFARNTGVEIPALDHLKAELDRGFVLAFAAALQHRRFVDSLVDRAIVGLVAIAYDYLAGAALNAVPANARGLVEALEKAFPRTRPDQLLGVPISVSFERIVTGSRPLTNFRDALQARGLSEIEAAEFTSSFVHSLFEAIADAYREIMDAACERVAAIEQTFIAKSQGGDFPAVQVARLTAEFEATVATIAGRTPEAAVEDGREFRIVRERLRKALRFVPSQASTWRAEFRTLAPSGFVLVLVPPPLGDPAFYDSPAGRAELHDLVRGYAGLCAQWQSIGARGLIWRTGVEWLDERLNQIVDELKANCESASLLFAEPDRHE